jgi:hypothetical protein
MKSAFLQAALNRAEERLRYNQRLYDRAKAELSPSDPQHARSLTKIEGDLISAQRDVGWCRHHLESAMSVAGLDLWVCFGRYLGPILLKLHFSLV